MTTDPDRLPLGLVTTSRYVDQWTTTPERAQFLTEMLDRHTSGDFGDAGPVDQETNREAFNNNGRVLSTYIVPDRLKAPPMDTRLWIITTADRSTTTVMWPTDEH